MHFGVTFKGKNMLLFLKRASLENISLLERSKKTKNNFEVEF